MSTVLPPPFLFRYCFPLRRIASGSVAEGGPLRLAEDCRLPDVTALEDVRRFGDLRMGWSPQGVAVSVSVAGKRMPLNCNPLAPTESDGLQIWIDTRNTQSVHRATRFCHHFCLLPAGGGRRRHEAIAEQVPIVRAREEAPLAGPEQVPVRSEVVADGWRLDAWLPAEVLSGFDPESSRLLGFYYCLRDAELGEQCLSVGRAFPFAYDPSLWATVELT